MDLRSVLHFHHLRNGGNDDDDDDTDYDGDNNNNNTEWMRQGGDGDCVNVGEETVPMVETMMQHHCCS